MAIGRISGQMLKANLLRSGTDLAFETNLLVLDVTNSFVGIGTATPARKLHISDTGALRLPSGTDAQRGTAAAGDIRYNSERSQIEGYVGSSWVNLGAGSQLLDTDGNTGIEVERTTDENQIHFFIETVGDVAHIRSDGAIELNNLEIDNQTITGLATNADINITPNGTGNVNLNTDTIRVGDSSGDITITTNDAVDLILSTNNGTNSGTITIQDGADQNIAIAPNGTGDVFLQTDTVKVGDPNSAANITTNGTGNLTLDTNAGTNSGSIVINQGANADINLTPNGTGTVNITKANIDAGTIDGTTIGGSSAAAGTFTSLTGNGTISITGTTTGSMDNVTIGGTTRAAGYFTTVDTSGNVTVGGNLTVNGTTTTIESTTLQIEDPLLVLAKNNSGGAGNTYDQGLLINRGSDTNQAFIWDESADEFAVVATTETGSTAGNITISAYAPLHVSTITATTLSNGAIDITQNNISATRTNDDLVLSPAGGGFVIITGQVKLPTTIMQGSLEMGNFSITGANNIGVTSLSSADSSQIAINDGLTVSGELSANGGLNASSISSANATLTGGTINNMIIGQTTRAAGYFTTVDANDNITISADNKSLQIGAGTDLTITHDGTNTTIDNNTGILKILGASGSSIQINSDAANVDTQISGDTVAALLYADASADKIGIGTSTPAYILDINSTDAVRLPTGSNGTRPTAATGVIRFNTDSSAYEGSTDGSTWTAFAMGGGGVAGISKVSATGDGSTSTFNGFFASAPATAANVLVFIDNVYQEPTENYTVSSTNISFTSAPHSGARIFALVGFDAGNMTTGGVARTQTDSVSFTSSATAIMTYNATSYRSAELFVQVTDSGNTEYSCMKANVIHDGTTAYISVYGIVNTGASDSVTLTATYTSGTVYVYAVSTGGASSATVQYSLSAV